MLSFTPPAHLLRRLSCFCFCAVKYICNHAELAAVACSTVVLGKMLEVLAECPTVRLLVSLQGVAVWFVVRAAHLAALLQLAPTGAQAGIVLTNVMLEHKLERQSPC